MFFHRNSFIKILLIAALITCMFACKKANNDNTPPVISIIGPNQIYTQLDSPYVDLGATASDETDGDISDKISTVVEVNIHVESDDYYVYYNVQDNAGNKAEEKKRRVRVKAF